MKIHLHPDRLEDYQLFLRIKGLPRFAFAGREAEVPDEYAELLGVAEKPRQAVVCSPPEFFFDYQKDITCLALHKRKFAVFAEPGLGKTLILLEYARVVRRLLGSGQRVLIVSPLM